MDAKGYRKAALVALVVVGAGWGVVQFWKFDNQRLANARTAANRQAALNVLARADALKPGMTEDEVVEVVGRENWRGMFGIGGRHRPAWVFTLGDSVFLIFEWKYEDVPNDTQNRRMYWDKKRNQRMVKIYQRHRVSEHPD